MHMLIPRLLQRAYCDGLRTQSNRQFPDGAPRILVVNVEFLSTSGVLAEKDFPTQIQFLGTRYTFNTKVTNYRFSF